MQGTAIVSPEKGQPIANNPYDEVFRLEDEDGGDIISTPLNGANSNTPIIFKEKDRTPIPLSNNPHDEIFCVDEGNDDIIVSTPLHNGTCRNHSGPTAFAKEDRTPIPLSNHPHDEKFCVDEGGGDALPRAPPAGTLWEEQRQQARSECAVIKALGGHPDSWTELEHRYRLLAEQGELQPHELLTVQALLMDKGDMKQNAFYLLYLMLIHPKARRTTTHNWTVAESWSEAERKAYGPRVEALDTPLFPGSGVEALNARLMERAGRSEEVPDSAPEARGEG